MPCRPSSARLLAGACLSLLWLTPTAAPCAPPAAPGGAPTAALLPVPAGCFQMGQDEGGEPDERPAHRVCVDGFQLERTEVTNEAYGACVRAKACPRPRSFSARHFGRPKQPVVGVTWHAAAAYCAWVGRRLPSEAEWEWAATGPRRRRFPWGDEPPDPSRASFGWQHHGPDDVGGHPAGAGPFGHLDLGGNVWEWVADVYHPAYYATSPEQNPDGGTCAESLAFFKDLRRSGRKGYTGSNPIPDICERVLRGGAWNYKADGLRVTNRVHHGPKFRIKVAGFRCAADAPAVPSTAPAVPAAPPAPATPAAL